MMNWFEKDGLKHKYFSTSFIWWNTKAISSKFYIKL